MCARVADETRRRPRASIARIGAPVVERRHQRALGDDRQVGEPQRTGGQMRATRRDRTASVRARVRDQRRRSARCAAARSPPRRESARPQHLGRQRRGVPLLERRPQRIGRRGRSAIMRSHASSRTRTATLRTRFAGDVFDPPSIGALRHGTKMQCAPRHAVANQSGSRGATPGSAFPTAIAERRFPGIQIGAGNHGSSATISRRTNRSRTSFARTPMFDCHRPVRPSAHALWLSDDARRARHQDGRDRRRRTAYHVKAEIPGVKKEDIHVAVEGNTVSISAEVRAQGGNARKTKRCSARELYQGKVARTLHGDDRRRRRRRPRRSTRTACSN